MELIIDGKTLKGILDTGTDVSIIVHHHWPTAWLLEVATTGTQGVGSVSHPSRSATLLMWRGTEGHSRYFSPYVLPHIPVNLWDHDILQDMGAFLVSPNSLMTHSFLVIQRLGKYNQGRRKFPAIDPVKDHFSTEYSYSHFEEGTSSPLYNPIL